MLPTIKETVAIYSEKITSETMEFSELRKTQESKGYEQKEIDIIVNRVDRNLIKAAELKHEHSVGKNIFIVGLLIMAAGILTTVLTYTGIVDLGNEYIVAYGPALGGLVTALMGKMKMDR